MIKVTKRQHEVLIMVRKHRILLRPRHTLELLKRKGLVYGDRREGFKLTAAGNYWLRSR
jgi:hypothetical protein